MQHFICVFVGAGHLDTAQKSKPSYTQFLAELLDIEVKASEHRALQSRLRLAGLPSQKTLEEFAALMGEENSPLHKSFFEKAKEFFR